MTKGFTSNLLSDYLYSGHHFSISENLLKFQFKFFNTMLFLAVFFSPFIAFIHLDISLILFYSDLSFSLISATLVMLLRKDKQYFYIASLLFVPVLYIAITLVFFIAGDDPTKVIWAPILFACGFLLQGTFLGLLWLFAVLSSYYFGFFYYGELIIGFSLKELILISISFITVSLIFNAFRQKNDADNHNLLKTNAALQEKSNELKIFNKDLESRIERELHESQNKTRYLQHHINLIDKNIITANIDLNGLLSNVSVAYCELNGYGKQNFISEPFTYLFSPNHDIQELKDIWKDLQAEKKYIAEVKNTDIHGDTYWLDMNISAEYTIDNTHIGYIMMGYDITDKKLVQQQQEQLISQSRHAAMGEMISMIAHQWRQPLATIAAISNNVSLDLNLGECKPSNIEEQMNKITSQIQHLSHTVDDFRDFFKPGKGLENTYVHLLVKEALKLLDHRLGKEIKIIYQNQIDTSLSLYHNELVQVLINIFNNAYDALSDKNIKDPQITVNEYLEDEYFVIEIGDNAGGINEDIIKNVFDPYFSTKTKNGTGLGLYMSKTIIEDHQKGLLEVFNRHNGAVFKISLPQSSCKLQIT